MYTWRKWAQILEWEAIFLKEKNAIKHVHMEKGM